MKKYFSSQLMVFCCCIFFSACNTATPENYFDRAVLNSNSYFGFADDGMLRELESPSVKMVEGSDQTVVMKRSEVMDQKIKFCEEDFKKLKDLKETDDTKEMLHASIAVYDYVLPVYKTEYVQLAKLYDDGAPPKEQIQSQAQLIHDKHFAHYTELYNKLISLGKSYAERHSIKVNWGVYDLH